VAAATTGFAASGAGLAAGYRHATLAAAVVAAGLAALAARAIRRSGLPRRLRWLCTEVWLRGEPSQAADHRRATAERNVAAILDAAGELLSQAGTASIAAVAASAGVSRVTVYAHFPTWEALLEAVVVRLEPVTPSVSWSSR